MAMAAYGLKAFNVLIPDTYTKAIRSPQADYWQEAMESQITKLRAIPTWELVPRPPQSRLLPGKWVYDLKINSDNDIQAFRARWVICGNRQRPGMDFDQTLSPVASEATVKLFLTAVALHDLK